LNSRLLPLSEKDIQQRFVAASKSCCQRSATVDVLTLAIAPTPGKGTTACTSTTSLYLHPILQTGEKFCEYLNQLNTDINNTNNTAPAPAARGLGILSWFPIDTEVPKYEYSLGLFGLVTYSLGKAIKVQCSHDQVEIATKFFELIWDARWRRRTKDLHFKCLDASETYFAFRVVCMDMSTEKLDFLHMRDLLKQSERSKQERIDTVYNISKDKPLARPRLWCPRYDENAIYLAHGR
jgi:hypothetical protein